MRSLDRLEIIAGRDREGRSESFDRVVMRPGDRVAVVGPTGSGKSRLLADIEWAADGDTPSGRRIHWDGAPLGSRERLAGPAGRVAQISQTMNFLMDLEVGDFLRLHAQAHGLDDSRMVEEAYQAAQKLTGEGFSMRTRLPGLSGGQSRALMIADAAILGDAPVVLVDELENAGVDRLAAMELLSSRGRIVILATHDPSMALSCPCRLVMGGGGVRKWLRTDESERFARDELERIQARIEHWRLQLRSGERLLPPPMGLGREAAGGIVDPSGPEHPSSEGCG